MNKAIITSVVEVNDAASIAQLKEKCIRKMMYYPQQALVATVYTKRVVVLGNYEISSEFDLDALLRIPGNVEFVVKLELFNRNERG